MVSIVVDYLREIYVIYEVASYMTSFKASANVPHELGTLVLFVVLT